MFDWWDIASAAFSGFMVYMLLDTMVARKTGLAVLAAVSLTINAISLFI